MDDVFVMVCRRGVSEEIEVHISRCYSWIPRHERSISPSNLHG